MTDASKPLAHPRRAELVRVALVQEDATVGALEKNAETARARYREAVASGADLVILPELFLTGYPPEDLLYLPEFLQCVEWAAASVAEAVGETPLVIGAPFRERDLHNGALVMQHGEIRARVAKTWLPNYGVFDEERYFLRADAHQILNIRGFRFGVTICEDLWAPGRPIEALVGAGRADVLLNLSASPYHRGKSEERRRMLETRALDHHVAVLFCNMVGGQDELVFDGESLAIGAGGELMARGPAFEPAVLYVDLVHHNILKARLRDPRQRYHGDDPKRYAVIETELEVSARAEPELPDQIRPRPTPEREVADALCTGLRDYVDKNGFPSVIFGLSGGIDSSLVAQLAVRALGPERVAAISLPSRFNSEGTKSDARSLAEDLGIWFREIPIESVFSSYLDLLEPEFGGIEEMGVAAENLQARIRGAAIMAFSNHAGHMVLATGNKSELSMGYATLYGDMVGGFAVIKDLTKTWVYRLARWLHEEEGWPLPEGVLSRPPSAELRADQTDQDSLPAYEVLDPILEGYVEEDLSADELEARGFDPEVIATVIRSVDRNEYKRRQGPPGIKITARPFGKGRRMPITQGFWRDRT